MNNGRDRSVAGVDSGVATNFKSVWDKLHQPPRVWHISLTWQHFFSEGQSQKREGGRGQGATPLRKYCTLLGLDKTYKYKGRNSFAHRRAIAANSVDRLVERLLATLPRCWIP